MKLRIVQALLIGTLFFSCNKEKLPKATQAGRNTFGCKIDGIVFKPYYTGGLFNNVQVLGGGNNPDYGFGINATNQKTDQSIYIEFTYLTDPGTYQLRQYPYRGIYEAGVQNANYGWYQTDSVNTGELIITRCDNANGIYSGRFSFTCKDPNTGKIVRVTDGRFDIRN